MKTFVLKYYPVLLALVGVALLVGAGYRWGAGNVQAKWDADKKSMQLALAEAKAKQAEVTTKVVTEYVDRVQVIREKGDTIIKEVPKYVPINTPDLPGGFRVHYDAAARGELPDSAGIADAAPVAAQDVAATTAENFQRCHQNAEQLTLLQKLLGEVGDKE